MSTELTAIDREAQETVQDRSLRGKTCLVTGASRGIGRAIALELARRGGDVVVNYCSSEEAAHHVGTTVEEYDADALVVRADVSRIDDVTSMVDHVHDEFGSIDVLVNNAGITADRRFDEMTLEEWNRVIDVNLGGVFHCTRAFYDDIRNAEHGRLINISSVVGRRGNYGQANYAASKSALFGFTRSIALELAPYESTANCIAPGFTRTDMVENVPEDIQDRIREKIPMGRFAEVEEIACTVGFLARDEASYITGTVIDANGGMYG